MGSAAGDDVPSFNKDIRPILSENCFLCHGQDPKHRGGELRLDIREEAVAFRNGIAAIVPGNPEKSEIIRRILTKDPDDVMPPPEAHMAAIPSKDIETLKRWIKAGAVYEPHWSFVAPKKSQVPAGTNPIDHFVNQRLTEENLKPSQVADPETLVRRVYPKEENEPQSKRSGDGRTDCSESFRQINADKH
jgi:hypothetical protein